MTAHTTIQFYRTADFQAYSKRAVSVGIFAGIVPLVRSLMTLAVSRADFNLPSLHPKIPFPAAGFDGQYRSAALSIVSLRGQKTPFRAGP
jgi:hypothetical protein